MSKNIKCNNWSKEKLLHEYNELLKRKKFGIVWENKLEDVAEQCKEFLPVLESVKEIKALVNDKNQKCNHIIEGDNYHALSVLNYTHKKAFDCIYIDPPYNNGDRTWKYNNNYVDKNDRFRHSKWLSMMGKRLQHAKRLLKDDGVLICAIDKNEQAHLGLLLEELFKDYEIHCIAIVHNPRGIQGDNFAYTNEFAFFVFRKGLKVIQRFKRSKESIEFRNLRDNGGESLRTDAKNCFYPIQIVGKKIIGYGNVPTDAFHPKRKNIKRKDGSVEVWPIDNAGIERKWRYARQSVEEITDLLRVAITRNGDFEIELAKIEDRPKTVWTGTRYDANEYGTKLVRRITGKDFPFPKSLYTVKDCLECVIKDRKEALVLDFFAGSGTTGHAVLEINAEDKGNRHFILCTNNEDNDNTGIRVARDICLPRIQNVIKGYKYKGSDSRILFEKNLTVSDFHGPDKILEYMEKLKDHNKDRFDAFDIKITEGVIKLIGKSNASKFQSGLGGNLRYFKTGFVQKIKTDNDKRIFTSKSTEMLCLAESTFDQVASKIGMFSVYENQKQMTGIIYDEDAIADFKKEAKKYEKPFVVYVFSYDHTYNEGDFEGVKNLKTVKPIPEVILNVYRKIYKELYKSRHL